MSREKQQSLFCLPQDDYASGDPDQDGSSFVGVPCENLAGLPEAKEPLPHDYADGSNYPSAPTPGFDGGEISFETCQLGLASQASDPTTVALDWFDYFLMNQWGSRTNMALSAVTADAAAAAVVVSLAAARVAGDPIALFGTGLLRTLWSRVTSVATLAHTLKTPLQYALASANAKSYGVRVYRDILDGGPVLTFKHVKGPVGSEEYRTLTGCRLVARTTEIMANKEIVNKWKFRYGKCSFAAVASLPAAVRAPASTPLKGALSPIHVEGVSLGHVGLITIDWGIKPLDVPSVHGDEEGHGDDLIDRLQTRITVNPINAQTQNEAVRAAATGKQITIQMGAGTLSGGVLNGCAALFDNCGEVSAGPESKDGLSRQKVVYTVRNPGVATGARFAQECRI